MSREQGPREAGMRPPANGAGRRRCDMWTLHRGKEAGAWLNRE